MVQPLNYNLQMPDIIGSFNRGLKFRRQDELAQAQNQDLQLQTQQNQAKMQRQARLHQDIAALNENFSTQGVLDLMLNYPELSEDFTKIYELSDKRKRQKDLSYMTNIDAALSSDDKELAEQIIDERMLDAEQARDPISVDQYKILKRALNSGNLNAARISTTAFLSKLQDPDKFAENRQRLEAARRERNLEGAKLTQAQAKANKLATESAYFEDKTIADLTEQGIRTEGLLTDQVIKRENLKIASLNAKLKKEDNQIKRQELEQKIEKAKLDREQGARDRVAAYKGQSEKINLTLGTINTLLSKKMKPGLDAVVGAFKGKDWYPSIAMAALNEGVTADEAANAVALIEAIGSQTFVTEMIKAKEQGATFGGLTEKEGEKLMQLLGNLGRKQGIDQFRSTLEKAQGLLQKSRSILADKYNIDQAVRDETKTWDRNQFKVVEQ